MRKNPQLQSSEGRCMSVRTLLAVTLTMLLIASAAQAVTLTVKGSDNSTIASYRWLIEEDTTKTVLPGSPALPGQQLSLSFHTSYAGRPIATGCLGCFANGTQPPPPNVDISTVTLDPLKSYYVSVLPHSGYTIGGGSIAPGQTSLTVVVNKLPLPTGQLSVLVFEDNFPINNAPNVPQERGLAGFEVELIEAGGTYGASGGMVSQDAFGNPLGTTYNPDGTLKMMGLGYLETDANGECLIQNLSPGKYSIVVIPPMGTDWIQTSTLEGGHVVDAWIKANEPPYFVEFGPPGHHVFFGFVHNFTDTTVLTGGATITGQITNLLTARPPNYNQYSGKPVGGAWVGLNDLAAGVGRGVFAGPCDPDTGEFSIPNVPPGKYNLAIWDENLLLVWGLLDVTVPVPAPTTLALGEIPVFNWFSKLQSDVFYDGNENGFRDPGEVGIPGQAINLRFRDGSIYDSGATDESGNIEFEELFPFFNWLVAEVDFARFKATGATILVDAGGPALPDTVPESYGGLINPQPQCGTIGGGGEVTAAPCNGSNALNNPNTGNNLSRTETGPVLVEAFQGFLGHTNVIQWGKKAYGPGENGGIAGIVRYGITRAEDDPRQATGETWEPGIPNVQVNLYRDCNHDGVIDVPNRTPGSSNCLSLGTLGTFTLADVDNYPFGWSTGGAKGLEDIDRNSNTSFDLGDALEFTTTDAWDDSLPTACQGDIFYSHGNLAQPTDCFDGLRNFNQVRPGVFDGGYAFGTPVGDPTIPSGTYIVEAVPPPGYLTQKEEDKNVVFGDEYTPNPALPPPPCVGDLHLVPQYLSLFPDQAVAAGYAGMNRPLCDRKQVTVTDGTNTAADFALFTEVPVAGHIVGIIVDDLANEFNPQSPAFGEKYSPPWLPISIRDWTGREIGRTYADEYGAYNALVPSTYTINPPFPSGVAPNMITVCLNNPGPIPDPAHPGQTMIDPFFNRQYSQFCYTFQYLPGKTTYLDTPVMPVAAFAGPDQFPLDCEYPSGTPKIYSVTGTESGGGPYVSVADGTKQVTIVSEGAVNVLNPKYNPDPAKGTVDLNRTIPRDYGFGTTQGTVSVVTYSGSGAPTVQALTVTAWNNDSITATVPAGVVTGQLVVTRGDNSKSTIHSVTLNVGNAIGTVRAVAPGTTIQAAIDAASPGDLILVPPGNYEELVIMWQPVRLQGWGAGSTYIDAVKSPGEKLVAWQQKVNDLQAAGAWTLLPGQPNGLAFPEPPLFNTEYGPGIIVLAKDANVAGGGYGLVGGQPNARIDGFAITGGDQGGGIFVNGYAHYLDIGNNHIFGNQGIFGGGIRLGHPELTAEVGGNLVYVNAENDNVRIHHNHINGNGGLFGAGGGVSLCTGSSNYRVLYNYICGNFTSGNGGGIGHIGKSDGGRIAYNSILFNQSFNQGQGKNGGGLIIDGAATLGGVGSVGPGSGSVIVNTNLFQGNLAGAGDGGAIRTQFVNGEDVQANSNTPGLWFKVDILNNLIVNNVAGLAGGAISMQDTANINIINNTIANNDSTATAGEAFTAGNPNDSNPQPAGIVSRGHSVALQGVIGAGAPAAYKVPYSNPQLINDIIYHNRSFYFHVTPGIPPALSTYSLLPDPSTPVFADLAVLGTPAPATLSPMYCLLTNPTGYDASNTTGNPNFVRSYYNGALNSIIFPEATTALAPAPAFDEGGNFIDIRFGPLTTINPADGSLFGNYHIQTGSAAIDKGVAAFSGVFPDLALDYDWQVRPTCTLPTQCVDIGADEFNGPGPTPRLKEPAKGSSPTTTTSKRMR